MLCSLSSRHGGGVKASSKGDGDEPERVLDGGAHRELVFDGSVVLR